MRALTLSSGVDALLSSAAQRAIDDVYAASAFALLDEGPVVLVAVRGFRFGCHGGFILSLIAIIPSLLFAICSRPRNEGARARSEI